jgi:alkanesulfonate monooxygenase SsuD/methylene tetrahydromethanopterin reductase-like flavin-dependent oxidoreductase (luciferase family)
MRLGLIIGLHSVDRHPPNKGWAHILEQVLLAEEAGLDIVVFEDALLYKGDDQSAGVWEAMAIASAIAASTSTIEFGPSVANSPYRSPAHLAKIAETIDEISHGRFILGLGAGNTDNSDYEAFGFATDRRYSRFAEAISIIHPLLKTGRADVAGEFYFAHDSELVMRGPRPSGPPIVIAGSGPKMLSLTAKYADGWNWWTAEPGTPSADLSQLVVTLDDACKSIGRDPHDLQRSLDVYSVDPLNLYSGEPGPGAPLGGSASEIAQALSTYVALGFDELRCDLITEPTQESAIAAIRAFSDVAALI